MPDGGEVWSGSEAPLNWRGGFWDWRPVEWLPWWSPPVAPPCRPLPWPHRLAWHVTVQCREAAWSANTVPPDWCWWGKRTRTKTVTAALRNGVPCRCFCPPGRCEGKSGRQRRFVPW